jgi:hypothetical protein
MSTHRFLPHHHEPDDFRPEPGADASADALDALLNEIAQDEGFSRTRPGARQQRPHPRTDANAQPAPDDLSAATRAFHRRFEEEERHDPGASALDPILWEQIMATTAPNAPSPRLFATAASPVIPTSHVIPSEVEGSLRRSEPAASVPESDSSFVGMTHEVGMAKGEMAHVATPPKIPRKLGMTKGGRRSGPPVPIWRGFANATLALVIVLAGVATWLVYDRIDGGGGTEDPPATVPGMADAPHTPEATDAVAPAVIPSLAYACDFSRDIPIFQQVDESPVEGTALLVTTGGDLVLTCPEEPAPIVLGSGVNEGQVGPAGYPGLVSSFTPPTDAEAGAITYLNVFTGKSVKAGIPPEGAMAFGTDADGASPWLVTNSFDNPGVWVITDLRSMESRTFKTFADPESPSGGTLVPPGTPVITATAGDTLVMGIMTSSDIDGEGALFDVEGLPGTLLVLDGSFDNAHWIDIPDNLAMTRRMWLSPDGEHLALKSNDGDASFNGTITYTIVRTSDGAEIASSEPVVDDLSTVRWVQDGQAIAYTARQSLNVLAARDGAEPTTVLDTGDTFGTLRGTYDPDVVTVQRVQAEEVATETPDAVHWMMYAVNTVTGESIEIDGIDVRDSYGWELPPSRYLVLTDTWVDDTTPTTYRVVDAVTGEEVGTLPDASLAPLEGHVSLGRNALAISNDGNTMVIAFNAAQIWLLRVVDGEPEIRQLPPLPGVDVTSTAGADLFISPDGTLLSATISGSGEGDRFLLDLTDPGAMWSVYPSQAGTNPGAIFFVPGTGD